MDPAGVDAGVCVLHWLDAEVWEGDFSEQDAGMKRPSLPSALRRCGANHIGCGHAKNDTLRNIARANYSVAALHR